MATWQRWFVDLVRVSCCKVAAEPGPGTQLDTAFQTNKQTNKQTNITMTRCPIQLSSAPLLPTYTSLVDERLIRRHPMVAIHSSVAPPTPNINICPGSMNCDLEHPAVHAYIFGTTKKPVVCCWLVNPLPIAKSHLHLFRCRNTSLLSAEVTQRLGCWLIGCFTLCLLLCSSEQLSWLLVYSLVLKPTHDQVMTDTKPNRRTFQWILSSHGQ
jgi:hypothetical protein